jgi:hypothetical protein
MLEKSTAWITKMPSRNCNSPFSKRCRILIRKMAQENASAILKNLSFTVIMLCANAISLSLLPKALKITTPHFKKLYRFYGRDTGKAIADYLTVYDETVDDSKNLEIFDPDATWKRKEVYHFEARELLVPIYQKGKLVYKRPGIEEIKKYCAEQVDTLWDEVKRFDNPHNYYVDLSQKLYDIKTELLNEKNERYEKN